MIKFLKELDALMKKYKIQFIYTEDECHNNHPITIDNGCDNYIKFQSEINDITIADKIKELSMVNDDVIEIKFKAQYYNSNTRSLDWTYAKAKAYREEMAKVELINGKTHLFLKNGTDFDIENSYDEVDKFLKGGKK